MFAALFCISLLVLSGCRLAGSLNNEAQVEDEPSTSPEIFDFEKGQTQGGPEPEPTVTESQDDAATPKVTAITPSSGLATGGTRITITGEDFRSGERLSVTVGAITCSNPTLNGSTSIVCVSGAGAIGAADVVVTNPNQKSGTLTEGFTYLAGLSVVSVTPTNGKLAGGGTLTLVGTGFASGSAVTIGTLPCTSVAATSSTQLTCLAPAGTAGTYAATVLNPDGTVATFADAYTFNPFPTVASIAPSSGGTSGGTAVTLTGTGFISGATVTIGGAACASITVPSSTSLTCTTPLGSVGAASIVVTNPDTQSVTANGAFTYSTGPTISGVSPSNGKLSGGGTLTISGSNFSSPSVTVGGSACAVTSSSASAIECTVPVKGAGAYDIVVTNSGGTSATSTNAYTYNAIPTLTSVTPTSGTTSGSTTITLTGTGFLSGVTVTVGGSSCTGANVVSATSITCVTPARTAGAKDVAVTNLDTQSVTSSGAYTYVDGPSLSSVSPTNGKLAGGGTLTLSGSGFSSPSVTVGGSACTVTSDTATTIECTLPAKTAASYDVVVTNTASGLTSTMTNGYTYNAVPTISSVSPNSGTTAGGTIVTISGTGFLSGVAVTIGAANCTSLTLSSSSALTCAAPARTAGAKDVVVTNADTQSVTGSGAYTYVAPPTITGVSPSNGKLAGGGTLTISGTDFTATALVGSVDIGGTDCDVTAANATSIECTIPAKSAGGYSVHVVNENGGEDTEASAYTYNPIPSVTNVAPTYGSTAGGTSVTLTGTGFLAGATAKIGINDCTITTVNSSTEAVCAAPAGTAGLKTVYLTNVDTQSGSASNSFTYAAPATQLTLTGPSNVVTGVCSTAFTVGLKDAGNDTTIALADTAIDLTGGGTGGTFYTNDNCATSATTITITAGNSTAAYYYKNSGSTPMSITPTVSKGGLTSANVALAVHSATPYIVSDVTDRVFPNNQVDQFTTTTVDFANYQTLSASDTGMTYACVYDQVIDGAVAAGTACSALKGTVSFNTSSGVFSWTPNMLAYGPYELKITGTNGDGSGTKVFKINVRELYNRTNLIADLDAQFGNMSAQVSTPPQGTWYDLSDADNATRNGELTGNNASGWTGAGSVAAPYALALDGTASFRVNMGADNSNLTQVLFNTWIKPASVATGGAVILGNGGASGAGFVLRQSASVAGNLEFEIGDGTNPITYDQTVLTLNPVAYWRLGDASGPVADSVAAISGTLAGNASVGAAGAITFESNNAAAFDGTGDYIDLGNPAQLPDGTKARTMCAWVKPTTTTAGINVIATYGTSGGVTFFLRQNAQALEAGSASTVAVTASNYFTSGNWYHVCVAYDGSNVSLFGNGQLLDSASGMTWNLSRNKAVVGIDLALTSSYSFQGTIDEFAIFDKALSLNQVKRMHQAAATRYCQSITVLANGAWSHVAGLFDGTKMKLYVDGTEECVLGVTAGLATPATDMYVGGTSAGANLWTGSVGDLTIHSAGGATMQVGTHYNATRTRFQSQTTNLARDGSTSKIVAATPVVPHDGLAKANIIVIPKNPYGDSLGTGQIIEIRIDSGTATLTGAGACRTPAGNCVTAIDVGGGHYLATAVSSTQGTVVFSGVIAGMLADETTITGTSSVLFDSDQFTGALGAALSANTTVDNSYVGKNLYITGGTITFNGTTDGLSFGHIIATGGTINHTATSAGTMNRLNIAVSSLNLQGGNIDTSGLGYLKDYSWSENAPATALASTNGGGSHGGLGGSCFNPGTGCDTPGVGPTYDNYRDPLYPGASGRNIAGTAAAGGGVARIVSTGACTFSGASNVKASVSGNWGAGGTVNLRCAYFSTPKDWTGTVQANGGDSNAGTSFAGGGGRVALVSSGDVTTFGGRLGFPTTTATLTAFKGVVQALGGKAESCAAGSGCFSGHGGAGTVYLKHSGQTYGDLIINGGTAEQQRSGSGYTNLISMAGTVNGVPGANTLPISIASPAGINANYANLFKGMRLRPDVANAYGTANDWSDDNVIEVASNTESQITATANFSGVSNGATFRSIDVLDHIHVSNAVVYTAGDIYAVKGDIGNENVATPTLAGIIKAPNGGYTHPNFSGSMNLSLSSGYLGFAGSLNSPGLTLSAITVSGSSNVRVSGAATTTGSFTLTDTASARFQNLTTTGDITVNASGAILYAENLNATNLNVSAGTVSPPSIVLTEADQWYYRLNITLSGQLNLSGGKLNAEELGLYFKYSYGPNAPSMNLRSTGAAGGSHGGKGGYVSGEAATTPGPTFGDLRNPNYPGGNNDYGTVTVANYTGGVIRVDAAGNCNFSGAGSVDANNLTQGASAGSILLKCGGFTTSSWTGTIAANGGNQYAGAFTAGGGGGRIAIISTGNAATFTGDLSYPNTAGTVATFISKVTAFGGDGTSDGLRGRGGAGTIYVKHSAQNYGTLIVNNSGGANGSAYQGTTFLPSLAGTVNGAPGATTLPVTVASTPALTADYTDLYKGLLVRPNVANDVGGNGDPTDDNIVEVASNDASALTMSGNVVGAGNGDTFRSINIFDYLYIGGGATLETNGDLYVLNGNAADPGNATFTAGGNIKLNTAGATFSYPGYNGTFNTELGAGDLYEGQLTSTGQAAGSITAKGGTIKLNGPLNLGRALIADGGAFSGKGTIDATTLTIQNGSTSSFETLNLSGNVTITSTSTSALTVENLTAVNFTQSGGGRTTHAATTASPAKIGRLNITLSGNFSLTGNGTKLFADSLGYPAGYSFGSSGPATALASITGAGGSHGGRGGWKTGTSAANAGPVFDNFRDPNLPGGGSVTGTGSAIGGGVIRLVAGGSCTFSDNSALDADGEGGGGAGGSIYVQCGSFSTTGWTGLITANGGSNYSTAIGAGGGGRIAIISTGDVNSFTAELPYPDSDADTGTLLGRVQARGGTSSQTASVGVGGAGTIYTRHSGSTEGDLLIDNNNVAQGTYGGVTNLLAATDNGSVLYQRTDANTAEVTNGSTPFSNKTDLFKNARIHIYSTGGTPNHDPADIATHTYITLDGGNGTNTLVTTAGSFPAITNDFFYRFLYKLDHLEIRRAAQVDATGADIWLLGCDTHSAATTFDVPAGTKLTVNSLSASTCTTKTTAGSTIFSTNTW